MAKPKKPSKPRDVRGLLGRAVPEYLSGKAGAAIVRLPSPEAAAYFTKMLPEALARDNAQEDFALLAAGTLGLIFNLDAVNENSLQKFIEEVMQEAYRRRGEIPQAEQAQGQFMRSIMDRHAHLLKDVALPKSDGKSIWDVIAEELTEEEQKRFFDTFFYLLPQEEIEKHQKEMEKRRGSPHRLRLILSTPTSRRLMAFKAMIEEAPLLVQKEKGMLDKVLSGLGASAGDFGPDGKHTKGFVKSLDESTERMKSENDRLRKLGY